MLITVSRKTRENLNLSPSNFPVKMSPYESEGDIERKGTETIIGFE